MHLRSSLYLDAKNPRLEEEQPLLTLLQSTSLYSGYTQDTSPSTTKTGSTPWK